MSEDSQDDDSQKTEDPTPKKLEEAHQRGQVVNSREINNWFILFSATIVIAMAGPGIMADMRDLFKNFIEQSHTIPTDAKGLGGVMQDLFIGVGAKIILPLLVLSFAGAIAGFMQTGPLFTFDPIEPKLEKISVMAGFKRLFSKRSLMELVKGIIKLSVIGAAAYIALRPYFDSVDHFIDADVGQSMEELRSLFMKMMIAVLSVLFILAIMDYLYQRMEFMKTMRMSKQEIRDEYKQTEGDPHIKGKLRQLREEKARSRMMQAVPTADVVITNPTHYAVALKYDLQKMNAPMMVAKGMDNVALRIKAVAEENKIPIVENATLARTLYASMDIDEVIPRDQYKAVAEVISYVFKLKGRRT